MPHGLGWVYAVWGRRADALKIGKGFGDLSSHAYLYFYQLATIYAGLGEKDAAFRLQHVSRPKRQISLDFLDDCGNMAQLGRATCPGCVTSGEEAHSVTSVLGPRS